jgi:phosphoenolpyruvate synthase/pyruvate phosphate dikinase
VGYSAPLQALRRGDEPQFGGKSANLGELLAAGMPVPPGFALSREAFAEFVCGAGLAEEIAGALARISGSGDVSSIGAAAQTISRAMGLAPLPGAIAGEVAASYESLGGGASPPVAVRSSAVGEDSDEATFAGQQASYLWIREAGPVCDAVRDCWISLYSAPAISYRARRGQDPAEAAMAVTVQQMVDAVV